MITITVKTQSGEMAEFRVEEIVAIDGKPFRQADETEFLVSQVAKLDGRLTTIERAIFRPTDNEGGQ